MFRLLSAFAGKLGGRVEGGELDDDVEPVGVGGAVMVIGGVVVVVGATETGDDGMVTERVGSTPISLLSADGDGMVVACRAFNAAGVAELITRPVDMWTMAFDAKLASRM